MSEGLSTCGWRIEVVRTPIKHEEGRREQGTETKTGASSQPSRRRWISITAILLALFAFALDASTANRLAGLGALAQFDVFFHADTAARIDCMVRNECGGRSSSSHPNLAAFLNPPIQATAWGLKHSVLRQTGEEQIRRAIALAISPLASALKAAAVFF